MGEGSKDKKKHSAILAYLPEFQFSFSCTLLLQKPSSDNISASVSPVGVKQPGRLSHSLTPHELERHRYNKRSRRTRRTESYPN